MERLTGEETEMDKRTRQKDGKRKYRYRQEKRNMDKNEQEKTEI